MEATNIALSNQVAELKMALVLKDDKIRELKGQRTEALGQIWEMVGHSGDVLNKAQLFDKYVNKEVMITMPKVIAILVGFHKKMEAILGEIQKLVPRSAGESSRPLFLPPKKTPRKEKPLDEVKTPLPAKSQSRRYRRSCHLLSFQLQHSL